MAGLLNRLFTILSGSRSNRKEKVGQRVKSLAKRKLRLELLENRELMAFSITGTVFTDTTDNGLDGADPRLSSVPVALFTAGVNGVFDNGTGDDVTVATTTSAATTGAYSFTNINTAGTYFVMQTSPASGKVQRSSVRVQQVVVSASQANGTAGTSVTTIDTFNAPSTSISAVLAGTNPDSNSTATAEALGGVRDIFANAAAGTIDLTVDAGDNNALNASPQPGGDGAFIMTYDGDGANANNAIGTQLGTGTNNFDLTTGGTANAFRLAIGTAAANTTITVRVAGVGGTSTVTKTVPISPTGIADQTLVIAFSELVGSTDLTQVGGIQFELSQDASVDTQIGNIETISNSTTINFANLNPMSIGNQVFIDRNNNGTFDNTGGSPEVGIGGVTVQLFADTNGNGVFNAGTDVAALDSAGAAITTTTSSSVGTLGQYTFSNLLPGSYFVIIPSSQTNTGGAAAGHTASTTVGGADVDNTNKGSVVTGTGIVTTLVSLVANSEPINDADTDANTNTTFDVGLVPQIDLTVAKTTTATVAATGSTITYTVTARNDGPASATSVSISDDLPDGLQVLSAVSSNNADVVTIPASASDTSSANPDNITVDIGTLTSSATTQRTITIVAKVLDITTGTGTPTAIANSATITGVGTDLGVLANSSTVSLPVQLVNDLAVVKTITTNPASTGTPATAAPGTTFTYSIVARNDGPSRATAVRVVDNLPDGIQIISATSSDNTDTVTIPATAQDTTAANNDDLTILVGDLAVGSGAQTTITVVGVVLSATTGQFTNVATIASTNTNENSDPVSANNTSSVAANAQRSIDLSVTKSITTNPASTAAPATAPPGSTITYTILARNDGPQDATTVRVTDNIPDGIRVTSVTSSDNTDTITIPASAQDTTATNPDDITVDIGNLVVGAGAITTITVIGVVLPGTLGTFTNVATIAPTDTAGNVDTDPNDNSSSIAAVAPRTVDLAVTKTGPASAISGNTITYTMTATNNGPSDAINVQVSDDIPDGIRVISATLNGTAVTVPSSASDTTASNPDNIVFSVGSLASGASNNTIIIVAAILPATAAGSLINSAVISTTDSATVETPNNNNSASFTTTLTSQNDVAITKTGPTSVAAGTQVTYTLNVTNNGPSTATSVVVNDPLPSNVSFVSGTSLIGSTTAGTVGAGSNNSATVTIPTLNPGETAVVTIRGLVSATATGTLSNTATVTATNDSNANNNTSSAVSTNITAPITAAISGRIYVDSDFSNTAQTTEPGISGLTVTLTGTVTSTGAAVSRTATTDASGNYSFTAVETGTYAVSVTNPNDFNFRAATAGTAGGTAGTRQITAIPLNGTNSTGNNIGFNRVFSKRLFMSSSTRP